jgi:hypothetical protein
MIINGGAGELVVRLDRKFDNFGEDEDVKINNKVEIYCFDRNTTTSGTLIFSGYISGYRPVIDAQSEYIEVTLLPYVVETSRFMLRDGTGKTEIIYTTTDPSDILKDIVDKYRADGGTINYSGTSIDDTNTLVDYTFSALTVKESIDKLIELTPSNWYYFLGPDNLMTLQLSDMENADHDFVIGKHINYMETWRRSEDIINTIYFVGQESGVPAVPMYRVYTNTGSINAYGIHVNKLVDQRVSQTVTADLMANRVITDRKDPEIRTTLEVLDDNGLNNNIGYDIESVKPGQTMRIRNVKMGTKTLTLWDIFEWDVDVWDQTLAYAAASVIQILSVEYTPTKIRIEASSRLPEISKRMEDIQKNLEASQTWNAPSTPTVG